MARCCSKPMSSVVGFTAEGDYNAFILCDAFERKRATSFSDGSRIYPLLIINHKIDLKGIKKTIASSRSEKNI